MDHGLDSYTCGFLIFFNFKMMAWGCNIWTLLIIQGVNFVFHVTTIEQYYTGEIILAPGNMVSDGVLLIIGVNVAAAINGPKVFQNRIF